jgi:hypothetical protein
MDSTQFIVVDSLHVALQAFAQAEDGRRTVAGQLVRELKEQWLREHLISLLQLLLHLARKDVADFANESGAGAMDVAGTNLPCPPVECFHPCFSGSGHEGGCLYDVSCAPHLANHRP